MSQKIYFFNGNVWYYNQKHIFKDLMEISFMILYDMHTHCNFSSDSNATPESSIQAAIDKGLKGIYFTDHNDYDYPLEDGKVMFKLDFDRYVTTLQKLREEYKNKITVYLGIEQGLSVTSADIINNYDSHNELDFIIGSSHLVNGNDPYYPSFWENRSTKEAITSYFESILANIKVCSNFDVYGHLDYIVRYAPDKDASYNWTDYKDLIDTILTSLIANGKGIEINTSGLTKGLRSANPCLGIVKRYHELGGEIITIGSDAHCPAHISSSFNTAFDMLTEAGFKYYTRFIKRKPDFISL